MKITLKDILFRKPYEDFKGNPIKLTMDKSISVRENRLGRYQVYSLALGISVVLIILVLILFS